MSTCFQILAFWRENDVIQLAPKIVLSIMVYSMAVSKGRVARISELKKFLKYVEPIKSYGALNF